MSSSSSSDGVDLSSLNATALTSLFLFQREKLQDVNTFEQCIDLIHKSKNIIVLTGAGCSVSCGIPDFRSRDGVYARLKVDFPDLPDPQSMFDIFYFEHDPRPFFKFAKEIYPGQFKPSLSHMFIKKLEQHGKLLRNYTQNIDTLEMTAQISNVIQCHGSFATATCTNCKFKVDAEFIREKIFKQEIPYCDKCKPDASSPEEQASSDEQMSATSDCGFKREFPGILKPDIVFFGEGLPDLYHRSINEDKAKCDLLIVIGSSLKVKPVANIPHLLPPNVPQIIINRESLKHMSFDVELLGDCDVIVNEILMRLQEKDKETEANSEGLEWSDLCKEKVLLEKIGNEESERLVFGNQAENSDTNDSGDEPNLVNGESKEEEGVEEKTSNNQEEGEEKKDEIKSSQLSTASSLVGTKYTKDYLKESSFLHLEPNMYIFHGAEIVIKNLRKKLRKLRKSNEQTDEAEANKSDKPKQKSCLGDLYKDLDDLNDDDDSYDEDSFSDDSDEETDESDDNEDEEEHDEEDGEGEEDEGEGGEQTNGYQENGLITNGNDEEDDEEDDDDYCPIKK